jgi:hypothetical protein
MKPAGVGPFLKLFLIVVATAPQAHADSASCFAKYAASVRENEQKLSAVELKLRQLGARESRFANALPSLRHKLMIISGCVLGRGDPTCNLSPERRALLGEKFEIERDLLPARFSLSLSEGVFRESQTFGNEFIKFLEEVRELAGDRSLTSVQLSQMIRDVDTSGELCAQASSSGARTYPVRAPSRRDFARFLGFKVRKEKSVLAPNARSISTHRRKDPTRSPGFVSVAEQRKRSAGSGS